MSPARRVVKHVLAIPHFKPISAIDRLDVKNILGGQAQNATHRRCDIFVHPIGKLDNDYGPFSRRAHQAPAYRSRSASKFPKYNLHS
jgi:hypothetical protein